MGVSTVNLFNVPSSLPNVPTNLASPLSAISDPSSTVDSSTLALIGKPVIPSDYSGAYDNTSSASAKEKKPTFFEGLLKLALDTVCTALTYYLTTTWGQSGGINNSKTALKVHDALGKIIGFEKVKTLTEGIARNGTKSTFNEYKRAILDNMSALLKEGAGLGLTEKEIRNHTFEYIHGRKLIAGSSIALLSYLRTVLFAPNADWSHPDLFSPVACASLALPIVANSLYYYVYDLGKTLGNLSMEQSVNTMDFMLDLFKAGNKAGRRLSLTSDNLANFLNGGVLFGAALFARGMRNHLEDTVLSKIVPEIKCGPKNFRETLKTSSSRAMLKMLLDAPVFLLITKGAAMVIDSFMNTIHPYNREDTSQGVVSYFGSPASRMLPMSSGGLTSQALQSA